MMLSLKRRLIWILLGLTLFAWVASALLTFGFVSRVMLDQVDRQLTQYSDLVNYISQVFASQIDQGQALPEPWMSGEFESTHLRPMIIDAPRGEQLNPALNIWLHDNLIAVMADSPRFAKPVEEGFDFLRVEQDDSYWRILSRYDSQTELWMRVGIELDGARWAMLGTLGRALLPLLVVLPLTVLLLYFGVSRGLQPLKILADQIARRNPGLLDPVDEAGVPAEMQGVVSSLNGLLQRLGLALESEQRFTANAAHELMTPLAAIKAEVQLCQLQLEDARGSAMLARIAERVDRASHTVEQLLTMARFDPDLPQPLPPVRLRALLLEVLAETAHLARDRGLEVALEEGEDVVVSGSQESLAIMMRNLLVNAFRYASDASTVAVRLDGDQPLVLQVCNDCPALSASQFDNICERFYRVPGSAGQGAGLGLSIVSRIASQHGADFTVGPRYASGEGFCARVQFTESTTV
jgi:signal transduction histidine kinase